MKKDESFEVMQKFADQCHKQVNVLPPEYRDFFMEFAANLTVMVNEVTNAKAKNMIRFFK